MKKDWHGLQDTEATKLVEMSPQQQLDKLWKRVPRKYRSLVSLMLNIRSTMSFNSGYNDGRAWEAGQQKKSKEQMRVDFSMSIQKLADSNAQLGSVLIRAIEKAL